MMCHHLVTNPTPDKPSQAPPPEPSWKQAPMSKRLSKEHISACAEIYKLNANVSSLAWLEMVGSLMFVCSFWPSEWAAMIHSEQVR